MSFPQWKGLWDWSLKYADGTRPSGFRPEDVDKEKMKWLDEALRHYMVDFSVRMKEIKTALERDTTTSTTAAAAATAGGAPGAAVVSGPDQGPADLDLEEREALLDELMDIVSSIDYARDLHKIGGLPVLLELLTCPHPSLQWRAAEVVATCVANNPPVQQWFLEGGVLHPLVALAGPSQPNGTVRTKALLALSGMVRHFGPGLQALRDAGGLALLVDGLGASDRRVVRKAMTLLSYVLGRHRADCVAAVAGGVLLPLVAELSGGGGAEGDGSTEASDMRQAALGVLLKLAACPATWAAVRDTPGLQGRLTALAAAHVALPPEEAEAQAEEAALLRQLTALLAAATAPPEPQSEHDHVSVEAFEAAGQGTTFAVNEPRPGPAAAADGDRGARGSGDQNSTTMATTVEAVPRQPGSGVEGLGSGDCSAATAAAPLLLGAP